MNTFETISSKNVFHADHFDVKELQVILPNTKKAVYHIVERKPTVSVLPINEKYELYLIFESKPETKEKLLKCVSGYIESGESPLKAAQRELKEETGIEAAQWEFLQKVETNGVIQSQSNIFLAKELEVLKPKFEDDEDIRLVKIPLQEAVKKILSGEIVLSSTIIGILLLDRLKREKKL